MTPDQIAAVVERVPGGARNVQDIYPLAPLQEGILFHHMLGGVGDPYLLAIAMSFDCRERVDGYVAALKAVVARHDILRTAVMWEGLSEPVQVVLREVEVPVEEVSLDPSAGDAAEQLYARVNPRHFRIDVRRAPWVRLYLANDPDRDRWVVVQLLHHLAGDHSTLDVMRREIRANLLGDISALPVPVPFRNLVAQARFGVSQKEHVEFFKRLLSDVVEPTAPFGLLDTQGDNIESREAARGVDDALAMRLRLHARKLGVSAASICHLAWAQVLARVSGRADVVFGTVMLGRLQGSEGADHAMGMFINTVPMRVRIDNTGVGESVQRTHALLADLLRHEHAPLALAQRCSGVPAPTPLFSALLNYRHGAAGREHADRWQGLDGIKELLGEERTSYPVGLSVDDLGEGFRLIAQVSPPIDPQYVCAMMHTALESLVAALDTAPATPVCALEVLPANERHQVLTEWNGTAVALPQSCVHEIIEAQAARRAEAPAVIAETRTLSYGELNARANQLAHALRALGVKPDARVAICLERGVDLVVAVLAVWKAGGAYVPLDPAYPAERLRFMLDDSKPVALLADDQTVARLPECPAGLPVFDVTAVRPPWAEEPSTNLDRAAIGLTPDHLAYIIYTSGSTGSPKGVMLAHRGLCNLVNVHGQYLRTTPESRVLQFASFSFDGCVFEMVMALAQGAALHLLPAGEIPAGHALSDAIRRRGITHAIFPPAVLATLEDDKALASLHTLVVSGDALTKSLTRRWARGRRLIHGYGPTEMTVCSTLYDCRPDDAGTPPIGAPIINTQIYVLNDACLPVPVGVVGELYIGGVGVARGYLGRPAWTAERFVPDPFSRTPGARLYRTGDLGRWRADGTIEFAGRADFQIKLRGYRIEPGEIEACLQEEPGVQAVLVIAREDVTGEKKLVAYYTTTSGANAPSVEDLRDALIKRLPEYMVPSAYVRLDAWPLTPNGKVDRRVLPAPDSRAYAPQGYEAPRAGAELALAEIWREVLRVDRVGRRDDFFALGGHSLLAVRVVARMQRALRMDVSVRDLFQRPILMDLAQQVEGVSGAAPVPIPRVARGVLLPLSFAQQRLWFLSHMEGDSEAYHIGFSRELRGSLDLPALRQALDRIVSRHEALRTTFVLVDGVPMQRIHPPDESRFVLVEHDVRGCRDSREELARLAVEETRAPFDLEAGPLIRGRLIRQSESEHTLFLRMHHIVSDGRSMEVLLQELSVLYGAFQRGEEDPFPELPVQYADYAVWQRGWVEGDRLREQADYWTKTLADAPALLTLPADRPRPSEHDHAGAVVPLSLNAGLTAQLRQLGQRYGATLYQTVLAGWAILLARLSNQSEVVVGTGASNRDRVEIENLIGFFINTLALRIDLGRAPTVGTLLEHVKEQVLAAQQHQEVPFEHVVEITRPVRTLAHSPVFQVAFALHPAQESPFTLSGLEVRPPRMAAPHVVAKVDLTLELRDTGTALIGGLEYATSLFDRTTIERHVSSLRTLLSAMVADGDSRVNRLAILPAADRQRVVADWNATAMPSHADACIHELFEAQVARAPDAPAVIVGREMQTYDELNAQANQLAHHLRASGVGPETCVAICLERGAEMIVAVLAVLKAGAAYLPLDPAYPADRLRFMLEDAQPVALVADDQIDARLPGRPPGLAVLDIGETWAPWLIQPTTNPDRSHLGLTPGHLAYVIYTSGSTGTPKGVLVPHRGLCNVVAAQSRTFDITPASRILQVASFSFDACVFEIVMALCHGAALHMLPAGDIPAGETLQQAIEHQEITHLTITPAALATMPDGDFRSLRTMVVAGDALTRDIVNRWGSKCRLLNAYGPTEATIWATLHECVPNGSSAPPIGRPIANTQVYVLDANGDPVPVGVVGELYIGGAGIARGYHRRPSLTAERFTPDPFSGVSGARLYRTGDLGRWQEAGTIEFVGRDDSQVKVRGYRIELGEIEATLAALPGVNEAVVLAREDLPGDKRLVAYYTDARDGTAVADPETLQAALAVKLPEYMMPAAFVRVDEWPLTPNRKLDRQALPPPEKLQGDATAYDPPVGPIETMLADVWAEVLGVDRVSRHDDFFFTLGGHSLLAVTMIERLRRRGWTLDVRELFATSTLADVAMSMKVNVDGEAVPPNGIPADCDEITPEMLPLVTLTREEVAAIVEQVPGGARNIQDIYPLAPLQEGILFHHLLEREGDPYLAALVLAFDSRARLDSYVAALRHVVARHDILRTSVLWEGVSEPVQVVQRSVPVPVEELSLDPTGEDAAAQLYALVNPRRMRLDVRQAPWLRIAVAHDRSRDRWVMVQRLHHLAGDHSTMDVMQAEIEAQLSGEGSTLPAPWPFRNLVAQVRAGATVAEHAVFFQRMLGNVTEPTAPFGLLDAQGDGSRIQQARRHVATDLSLRLRRHARQLGISAASVCHLAWAHVLACVSGRRDVVFGTVLLGRLQGGDGADRAMGLFINTLPVRIRLDDEGVVATVRRTHGLLTDLMQHEHASLALAQRSSGVPAPTPLFAALLNYRHSAPATGTTAAPFGGQGIQMLAAEERTNYPVTFSVDDLGEDFGLTAQVVAPIDPRHLCDLMHTALDTLVTAMETTPDRPASQLTVLPDAERQHALHAWNTTAASLPTQACIHKLFEAQVARTPAAPAVSFNSDTWTYGELNGRANQLARHLGALGVGAETRVAICLERGIEMVMALLAVWKAGGAYVPLDPDYPPERLAYMLADAGAAVLLTDAHLGLQLTASDAQVALLDRSWDVVCAYSEVELESEPEPESLAYVIYTSGSTGRPKGVEITHRALCNLLVGMRAIVDVGPGDVLVAVTSLSFDIAGLELFLPLVNGACVRVVSRAVAGDGAMLRVELESANATLFQATPVTWRLLAEAGWIPGGRFRALCGGEALPSDLARWLGQGTALNVYGPTETTIWSAAWAIEAGAERVLIGRPLANTELYVLDDRLEPVPIGVVGELYIGGLGVARGYHRRPGITAERFIPDPFGMRPGARLYRTGDLARWHRDGQVECLGRVDQQLKVRGFRIEPGEIEVALLDHPGIKECVVLSREDTPGDARLVAYYICADYLAPEAADLRAALARRLPQYMVPAVYVRMDDWPLTPNGKLDRKALPVADGSTDLVRGYEAPAGMIEAALAEVWAQVLGVDRVGRHDNFFALGGHSLLAVAVIERLRRRGWVLAVRDLFATPSLADLAAAVHSRVDLLEVPPNLIPVDCGEITPEMLPLIALTREELATIARHIPGGAPNIQDIYPLAPLQEGILFHHVIGAEGDPYLLSAVMSFDTPVRMHAYIAGLRAVVARHDILRTAVLWEDLSEPVQVVLRTVAVPVEEVAIDPAEDVAQVLSEWANPRRVRLDVRQAPWLRAFVASDPAHDRWVMVLQLHHLAGDHQTLAVMQAEIEAYLEGRLDTRPAAPPFRELIARAKIGSDPEQHAAFFRHLLADVTEPTAPFGLLDVRGNGSGVEQSRRRVDADVSARLRRQARVLGVNAASVCHLAWALVLAQVSGREDVVFGTVLFGRLHGSEGTDRAMGLFINTLPVRIRLDGEGVAASVRRTHGLLADLMQHEHASLALAQRCSGVPAPTPLFAGLLNYRHAGPAPSASRAWQGIRVLAADERTNYPITLAVDDMGEGFGLTAQVVAPVDPRHVCDLMNRALDVITTSLETAPDTPVRHLTAWPDAARPQPAPERAVHSRRQRAGAARHYESPIGPIEIGLAAIWKAVLRIERVGRHDDFFDLGGHSLLTMRVVNAVRQMGIAMTPLDVFNRPTIELLAAEITSRTEPVSRNRAICVRQGGSQPPIFFVHDGAGYLNYVSALTPYIDADTPVFALPPSEEAPLRTIEEMAARMVRMIRAVQATGPYRVAGWSFGGTLAYEVAGQLIGLDQDVEFVGLLDSHYTAGTNGLRDPDLTSSDNHYLLAVLGHLLGANPSRGFDAERDATLGRLTLQAADVDFATLVVTCKEASLTPHAWDDLTPEEIQDHLARARGYGKASSRYAAYTLPVPVHFFAAEDQAGGPALRGWEAVLEDRKVRIIPVPGDHDSMMTAPNVGQLGTALARALAGASLESREVPERDYAPFVVLQAGMPVVVPLLCVPGAGASVTTFVELTASIGGDRPVVGFEPRGLDGALVPHSSVAATADAYIRAFSAANPPGPIHLLGHSFGGWIAFEMATRFPEAGFPVSSLTILDSEPPSVAGSGAREFDSIEAIMAWIESIEYVVGCDLGVSRSDLESRNMEEQRKLLHGRLVMVGLMPGKSTPDVLRGALHCFATALRTSYRPDKRFSGPTQLLIVEDEKLTGAGNRDRHEHLEKEWTTWAPQLVCRLVPGNHLTVLKAPHAGVLARLLPNDGTQPESSVV